MNRLVALLPELDVDGLAHEAIVGGRSRTDGMAVDEDLGAADVTRIRTGRVDAAVQNKCTSSGRCRSRRLRQRPQPAPALFAPLDAQTVAQRGDQRRRRCDEPARAWRSRGGSVPARREVERRRGSRARRSDDGIDAPINRTNHHGYARRVMNFPESMRARVRRRCARERRLPVVIVEKHAERPDVEAGVASSPRVVRATDNRRANACPVSARSRTCGSMRCQSRAV